MSHSVTVEVNFNNEAVIQQLCKQKKELQEFVEKNKSVRDSFASEIARIISSIDEEIEFIETNLGKISASGEGSAHATQNARLQHEMRIDSILKRVAMLKSSLNFTDEFVNLLVDSSAELQKKIVSGGWVAFAAVEALKKNGINLTIENLEQKMLELHDDASLYDQIHQAKQVNVAHIKNSNFPEKFKVALIAQNNSYNTLSELTDLSALTETLVNSWDERKEIIEKSLRILQNIGFGVLKDGIKYEVLETHTGSEFRVHILVKNKTNNTIQISFELNGKVKYKMGNYEKHFCEKDSYQFLAQLKKEMRVENEHIIRDISNARPILKEMRIKEK